MVIYWLKCSHHLFQSENRLAMGRVVISFRSGLFHGYVWIGGNELLYIMGWGGLGIRQMQVVVRF
jgi:hypothetical protein